MEESKNKYITLPALFNNNNLLEFALEPNKRYLNLSDSFLQFYVELEESFVPDNNFGNKLFEYLDLTVNYEDCSFKSSPNDYDFTSHINDKIFRNQKHMEKLKFEGHFDSYSYDSSELKQVTEVVNNRRGESFTKTVVDKNGLSSDKVFYRYFIMLPLNHGLCRDGQILPAGTHVRLTFHRAKPSKALVDISDEIISFDGNTISIIDPLFQSCWTSSEKLTQQMAKVNTSGISIPFHSSHIRHRVLASGSTEYTIDISQGPLPEYMVFFLMEPERFNNDLKLSSTKMSRHGLDQFSLTLDNVIMENYPLKVIRYEDSTFYHEFYKRWLVMTSNYTDTDEPIMTEETYINTNFMILETFQNFVSKEGQLVVNLKFEADLQKQMLLCWMPCIKKNLNFDRNLVARIN